MEKQKNNCFITEIEGERRASWIELFFDLVFVVAIASLADQLKIHLSVIGIIEYIALFLPVWWVWLGLSYFADQFDIREWSTQWALFLTMFFMIVLSIFIPNAFGDKANAFALTYIILRLLLIGLYAKVWCCDSSAKRFLSVYTLGFSLSVLIYIISLFLPSPTKFVLWGVGFFIDLLTPIIAYFAIKVIPKQISHMDERFGLFVIIVLGETIVSVGFGVRDAHWHWQSIWVCVAGFISSVMMWMLYFRHANLNSVNQALSQGKKAMRRSYIYGYSHFFLFISMVAFGVGLETAVDKHLFASAMILWLITGSSLVFLFGISLIHWGIWQLPYRYGFARLLIAIIILIVNYLLIVTQLYPPHAVMLLETIITISFISLTLWEQRIINLNISS